MFYTVKLNICNWSSSNSIWVPTRSHQNQHVNCHGNDPYSTDKRLAAVFDLLNMEQRVHSPTRDNRLVDILACFNNWLIHDVILNDAGNESNHRLIKALFYMSKRRTPVTFKFRFLWTEPALVIAVHWSRKHSWHVCRSALQCCHFNPCQARATSNC